MWYGNDEFDAKSYGKFIRIPSDNGGRMNFEELLKDENKYEIFL